MSANYGVTWPITPHTGAKHSIFRRHLAAWFPKLSWTGHLRVVDGFAGPGEYSTGEPGSPVIAVNAVATHKRDLSQCQMDFLFIEEDRDRYGHLTQIISSLTIPPNVSVTSRRGSFKDEITKVLDEEQRRGTTYPSQFFMLDPFGYEGIPLELMARLIKMPKPEFLISFMYDSVNRFIGDPAKETTFTSLFGTDQWKQALHIPNSTERWRFLLDLYVSQLRGCGLPFIRPFSMRGTDSNVIYFLIFGTTHKEGMRVMKSAMWSVDPSGSYSFSDATNSAQITMFTGQPDFNQLRMEIMARFGNAGTFTDEALEDFVLLETAFRETHYKVQILKPWEISKNLTVVSSPRKRPLSYPAGTSMRLSP